MVDLSYYVLQPLISSIKTGNIWHDCLIIMLSVFCLTFISKMCTSVMESWQSFITSISWRRIKARYSIDISTTSSDIFDTRIEVPEEYLGLIHYLHSSDINICSAKLIPTYTNRYKTKSDTSLDELVNYLITSTGKEDILIAPTIYLHIEKENPSTTNTYSYRIPSQKYTITLYSYKLTLRQLKTQVNEWTVQYREYIKGKNKGNFYRFTFVSAPVNSEGKTTITFYKDLFVTTKSFDNIFFNGKEELIKRLDFFLNNPSFYQKRGIAHSLGLLFYGSPGCGKTSMVKAIAAYTKRHLVEIPLSRIRTCAELQQALFLNSYDMVDLDFDKKIIIFEDIDCMSQIVQQRLIPGSICPTTSDVEVPSIEKDDIIFHLEDSDIKARKKKISKQTLRNMLGDTPNAPKDPLTLSFLLNLIDGIIEQPSRILIMTTNHPEQIDPALLRPGRVDIKQEFKRCTKPIVKTIIEYFFEEENDIDVSQLADSVHSPAEVIAACMSSSDGKNAVQLLSEQALPNVIVEARNFTGSDKE
ncbi:unnamed protein product [Adineta ricciae]|uniref:AAA+ ATPase domain-containing protein n=1 Tax=Adineta ricciae TaxID=249248 RepID=A0A815HAM3_ADIRI|nr:unnamed protein product [Adineta ricciae]